MCCVGAIFKDQCPKQPFIPIYLIVGGAVALWETLSGFIQSLCLAKDPENEHSAFSKLCKVSETIVGCFTTAWFIAGEFSLFLSVCLSLSLCVLVEHVTVVYVFASRPITAVFLTANHMSQLTTVKARAYNNALIVLYNKRLVLLLKLTTRLWTFFLISYFTASIKVNKVNERRH